MPDASGRLDATTHLFATRVYFEDTDAAGIVYHARYLHFFERARTEMMRLLGSPHAQMTADHGVVFAVRRCEVDYLRPARLDDALEVRTRVTEIGGASLTLEQHIWRGNHKLVDALVRLACMTMAGRPARIPLTIGRILNTLTTNTPGPTPSPPGALNDPLKNDAQERDKERDTVTWNRR